MNSGHVAFSTKFRDLPLWLFLSSVSPKLSGFQELLFPIIWLEKSLFKVQVILLPIIMHDWGNPQYQVVRIKGERERQKHKSHFSTLFVSQGSLYLSYFGQKHGFSPRDFGAGVMVITFQIHDSGCPWYRTGRKNRKNKTNKQTKKPVGITWVKVERQKRKNTKETRLYMNFSSLGSPP